MSRIPNILPLLFLILTTLLLVSCEGYLHTFTHEVTGTAARTNITYQGPKSEDYTQLLNQSLPWSLEVSYIEPYDVGNSYYLSAHKLESDSVGTVIVTVYIDGVLYQTEQTSDSFGFVAVYGTTP